MLNLNGGTGFLEETSPANLDLCSQLSACSAKSNLSYLDSPRSQPLSLAPRSSPPQPLSLAPRSSPSQTSPNKAVDSLGVAKQQASFSSPVPLTGSLWNNIFVHQPHPPVCSSPSRNDGQAVGPSSIPTPVQASPRNPSCLLTAQVPMSQTIELASREEEGLAAGIGAGPSHQQELGAEQQDEPMVIKIRQ